MKYSLDFEKPVLELQKKLSELKSQAAEAGISVAVNENILKIEKKLQKARENIYNRLTAWQRVQIARHHQRPYTMDYIKRIFI